MSENKKITYDNCRVAYIPGGTNVCSFFHPDKDEDIYFGKSFAECQKKYPRVKLFKSLDSVIDQIKEAQDKKYVGEFTEITEEQWWEMFECLPPYRTTRHNDGLFFCFLMSEYMTSNITGHYFRIQDRYFCANKRDTEKPGDLYKEIMDKFFINES